MSEMSKRLFRIEAASMFTMVLLPLFVLAMMVGIVNNHVLCTEIEQSNERQMRFTVERISGITMDMQRLNVSLTTNPAVTLRLKSALQHAANEGIHESEYAVYNAVLDLIYASAYRNEYIDSIYIYFDDGGDFFISSEKRLTNLREYRDTAWFDAYMQADPFVRTWSQIRDVVDEAGCRRELMTIYCRIFAGGVGSDRGVLVLNIDKSAIDDLLESLSGGWHTQLCVADEHGNPLFFNEAFEKAYSDVNLRGILDGQTQHLLSCTELSSVPLKIGGESYACLVQPLSGYGWRVVRLSPYSSLYGAPHQVFVYLLAMLMGTMLFGVLFAYQVARRNNRNINSVLHSIQRAKQGRTLPDHEQKQDAYSETLQNVVDTFLEKEYLTMQLAERRHHAELLELQALQAQLNPHFLFNTMTTIQWKAIALTGGRNPVSDMIEGLSDLLHYVLDTGTELTSLAEELSNTDTYVSIQKIRYADRFEYACCCEECLLDVQVMKMLLQPLVENSLAHGMRGEEDVLRVEVSVCAQEDMLCIRVSDNGEGMDEQRLEQVRKGLDKASAEQGRHIGLYNVNKRIVLTYGEAYGLEIDSVQGAGTDIFLRLPLRCATQR